MDKAVTAEIGQYCDYFSNWWGLEDGTLLETTDPRGYMWIKIGNEAAKPDHETVRRILEL